MKVTARDIQSAWLENSEDTYHTENKSVGKDRKQVEGPFQTQEDFPNSWLPTQQAQEAAFTAVEVVEVEVAVKQAAGDVLPGVSPALFNAWNNAHEAGSDFGASQSFRSLERFANAVANFLNEAIKIGSSYARSVIRTVKNFPANNAPRAGQEGYDSFETEDLHMYLDRILSATHSEVLGLTGTDRTDWYSVMETPDKHETTPVMYLSPEEYEELGMQPRVSPSELRDRRGPGAPFLEDLWRRKRDTELKGMKIKAIDVIRDKKPKKTKKVVAPVEEAAPVELAPETDTSIQQVEPEVERPHPYDPNEPEVTGDPALLAQPIANWDWEVEDDETAVAGSVVYYRKTIYLNDPEADHFGGDQDVRMEMYAFVEPNLNRKKRLLDLAKSNRKYRDTVMNQRAEELQEEADGAPSVGYINDIEVFYNDDLIFHRERSFLPKRGLQKEFMAGDSMQRAITDLQQFVRTQIDPIPVGQFIQRSLDNPGKGIGKLSKRDIEAADVLDFDPKKRRVRKDPLPAPHARPEQGYGLGPSKRLQEWFNEEEMRDPGVADFIREVEQEGVGGVPIEDPFGDSTFEELTMLFDTAPMGLEEIANAFIRLQPKLTPDKQKQVGRIIAKIRAAIRALSPETKPLR